MTSYSKTPLLKKLGIKENYKVQFIHLPAHYLELLGEFPSEVELINKEGDLADFIHIFCENKSVLETHFPIIQNEIKKNGMIWISWYKKASKIPTDLTGDIVRNFVLTTSDLVDVKVCSVDDNWSGLKVVWRKENR